MIYIRVLIFASSVTLVSVHSNISQSLHCTLCRSLSVYSMNTVDLQYIAQLLGDRKTYQDISDTLTEEYQKGYCLDEVNKL